MFGELNKRFSPHCSQAWAASALWLGCVWGTLQMGTEMSSTSAKQGGRGEVEYTWPREADLSRVPACLQRSWKGSKCTRVRYEFFSAYSSCCVPLSDISVILTALSNGFVNSQQFQMFNFPSKYFWEQWHTAHLSLPTSNTKCWSTHTMTKFPRLCIRRHKNWSN